MAKKKKLQRPRVPSEPSRLTRSKSKQLSLTDFSDWAFAEIAQEASDGLETRAEELMEEGDNKYGSDEQSSASSKSQQTDRCMEDPPKHLKGSRLKGSKKNRTRGKILENKATQTDQAAVHIAAQTTPQKLSNLPGANEEISAGKLLSLFGEQSLLTGRSLALILRRLESIENCVVGGQKVESLVRSPEPQIKNVENLQPSRLELLNSLRESPQVAQTKSSPRKEPNGPHPTRRCLQLDQIVLIIRNNWENRGRWIDRPKVCFSLCELLNLDLGSLDLKTLQKLPSHPNVIRLLLKFHSHAIPLLLPKMCRFLSRFHITVKRVFADLDAVPLFPVRQMPASRLSPEQPPEPRTAPVSRSSHLGQQPVPLVDTATAAANPGGLQRVTMKKSLSHKNVEETATTTKAPKNNILKEIEEITSCIQDSLRGFNKSRAKIHEFASLGCINMHNDRPEREEILSLLQDEPLARDISNQERRLQDKGQDLTMCRANIHDITDATPASQPPEQALPMDMDDEQARLEVIQMFGGLSKNEQETFIGKLDTLSSELQLISAGDQSENSPDGNTRPNLLDAPRIINQPTLPPIFHDCPKAHLQEVNILFHQPMPCSANVAVVMPALEDILTEEEPPGEVSGTYNPDDVLRSSELTPPTANTNKEQTEDGSRSDGNRDYGPTTAAPEALEEILQEPSGAPSD